MPVDNSEEPLALQSLCMELLRECEASISGCYTDDAMYTVGQVKECH